MPGRVHALVVFVATLWAAAAAPGAQSPSTDYSRRSDVIYGRSFGLALTMEVFTPAKPNGRGVVWVVSSGGYSGRERTLQPSFEARIAPLLARGYTVFAASHGSSPLFAIEDYIADARRAVRVVRHHAPEFRVDPARLGIAGSSSGGIIALIVALKADEGTPASADLVERVSSRVQAAGVFFPGTDLENFGIDGRSVIDVLRQGDAADPGFQFYDVDPKTGARRPVSDAVTVRRRLRDVSPIAHVTSDDPPTLLIHGETDPIAPIQQSRRLLERLTAAGVAAGLVAREGMGHAWPGWEQDSALIADWFDRHLTH